MTLEEHECLNLGSKRTKEVKTNRSYLRPGHEWPELAKTSPQQAKLVYFCNEILPIWYLNTKKERMFAVTMVGMR
jgi:hypothetical protein